MLEQRKKKRQDVCGIFSHNAIEGREKGTKGGHSGYPALWYMSHSIGRGYMSVRK
jgi:hypothetical protein